MLRYRLMQLLDWLRRTPLAWMVFWEWTTFNPPPQPVDDQKPGARSAAARSQPFPWGGVWFLVLGLLVLGWLFAGMVGLALAGALAALVVGWRYRRDRSARLLR